MRLLRPASHGESGYSKRHPPTAQCWAKLGRLEERRGSCGGPVGDRVSALFAVTACGWARGEGIEPRGGLHLSGVGWKGWRQTGLAPLGPRPGTRDTPATAASCRACLGSACPGVPSLSVLLHQRGSDLLQREGLPGGARSPPGHRSAAGRALLSLPRSSRWPLSPLSCSTASAASDAYFQGLVSILLTGCQVEKTTNMGVEVYDTVNKAFFEILMGTVSFSASLPEVLGRWD